MYAYIAAYTAHFLKGTINPSLLASYHVVILTLLEGSHNIWHSTITSLPQKSTLREKMPIWRDFPKAFNMGCLLNTSSKLVECVNLSDLEPANQSKHNKVHHYDTTITKIC